MKTIEANKRIGLFLKDKRVAKGMTQTQLAEIIGTSASFVGKYEAGRGIEVVKCVIIAEALEISHKELLQVVGHEK